MDATISSVNISCQDDHFRISHHSNLGKVDDNFCLSVMYIGQFKPMDQASRDEAPKSVPA